MEGAKFTSSSFNGDEIFLRRILFDADVLVFVEQTFVVHLPGDWAALTGGGVFEGEDLVGFCADGLGHGHARGASVRVYQKLDLTPFVRVELRMRQSREQAFAAVVFPRAIIPTPTIRWLKLNAAERIESFSVRRSGAENQHARLMVRGRAADMPHGEDDPVITIFLFRMQHTATFAEAYHRAVLDGPSFGDVRRVRALHTGTPTLQRLAIKERGHLADLVARRLRERAWRWKGQNGVCCRSGGGRIRWLSETQTC